MAKKIRTIETLHIFSDVLCLNFIDTTNSLPEYEHDYLGTYSDLAGWGQKIGLYSAKQSSQLLKQAKQNPKEADKALQKIKTFRELLYRVFASLIKQNNPGDADMDAVIEFYGEAISNGHFVKKDESHAIEWNVAQTYDAILWPIACSAGQLFLSRELSRVSACNGCGWLFLDISKNQSRRWCSMDACGVSDKMRRYHRKLRVK